MLHIKKTLITLSVGAAFFMTGCSDSDPVVSLKTLKDKGFVVNPKFKPAIEMFGAKDGWNGKIDGKKVTFMMFSTSSEAEDAATAFREISRGNATSCNASNMMISVSDETCNALAEKLKSNSSTPATTSNDYSKNLKEMKDSKLFMDKYSSDTFRQLSKSLDNPKWTVTVDKPNPNDNDSMAIYTKLEGQTIRHGSSNGKEYKISISVTVSKTLKSDGTYQLMDGKLIEVVDFQSVITNGSNIQKMSYYKTILMTICNGEESGKKMSSKQCMQNMDGLIGSLLSISKK